MKKNISINISGIIFHIEEDAFEKLRDYLDSINRYFSSFEGSQEIIADIESRIAEIFLAKLNEGKQIINTEDVDSLIATMGSIKDFQAVEEQDTPDEGQKHSGSQQESDQSWSDTTSRKMYRDEKRKLLAGVCAGMAHYFNIDPLWIRLITIILFLGSYGGLILAYIILWVVLPPSYDLSEDKKLKKMYRNPDGKVIAGVSSGVATYFGVDVVVIRVLFVIFTFLGGSGLLAYIILWIILPEAKSITDKVQMQGDPVTLSNIESNIKKGLHVEEGEENILIKILLFPFRLIAAIINGLGKALGPIMLFLVEFIRVIAGVIFIITGVSAVLAMVIALGAFLGIFTTGFLYDPAFGGYENMGLPLDLITDSFPTFTSIAAFLVITVPSIFLILLGASIIGKRIIFNATVGWSLFAIFIISGIVVSANIPRIVYNFREEGEHKVTENYDLGNKTAILTLKEVGMEDYDVTTLKLRGHSGSGYELVQVFESRGRSRKEASENAQMISYNVTFMDSVFTFDSNIRFKDDAIFRAQHLDMTLYIPYNKPFMMEEDMKHIIRNTIYRNGYRVSDMENNTWIFTEEGSLKCTTCPERFEDEGRFEEDSNDTYPTKTSRYSNGEFDKEYTFRDGFQAIDAESAFIINVVNAKAYKVGINGQEKYIDDIDVYVEGDKLFIDYDGPRRLILRDLTRNDIEITVYTPELTEVELTGACKFYMNNFKQRNLSLSITGASYAKLSDIQIDDMDVELTGASEMILSGESLNLRADLSGASHMDADDFKVSNAAIEAHGASTAKVYVTKELEIEETFASKVNYRGGARVTSERNGL
ncbi:PspC domain-containing protein [Fulvivirga sp. 29W222]|uniref:PspC domain-containing protein n=1 Tax=Fulvivirga marina TaxID=2494733 RepID=A0A937KD20_9BACT|nr:PspC domain-containing protein [Fulvivirga marina]MBL6448009.1 PspC domain-containing protein [Fulvivirga marina]